MENTTDSPRALSASDLLGLGDVTQPCHYCKLPGADTCWRNEEGEKFFWHERCNALKLMEAESHLQTLTVEIMGKRCKPWERIDLAGKAIRRAKRLSRPNEKAQQPRERQ